MGFFSDLKEDLSHAVNELKPSDKDKVENITESMPEDTEAVKETVEVVEPVKVEAEPVVPAKDMVVRAQSTEENKGAVTTMDMNGSRTVVDETSIITSAMSVMGDIVSEGSMDVIGKVIGNIDILGKLNVTGHIDGNSKAAEIYAEGAKINGEIASEGAVKIGARTVVVGNISATSAVIAGAVKGDIDVCGPVILDATAIVMGNIKSKSVQINNGAVIEGMCSQCYAEVSPTSFFEDYKMEMKRA